MAKIRGANYAGFCAGGNIIYDTAQVKLDTHFGLLASVYRFYLRLSSMLTCYFHAHSSCSVTNLTHEWWNLTAS